MTRKAFYKKLRECAGTFQWKITRNGRIRGVLNKKYYCPITAVAKSTGKGYWNCSDANVCGILGSGDSSDIMKAADHTENTLDEFFNKRLKQTRKALMRAVGL